MSCLFPSRLARAVGAGHAPRVGARHPRIGGRVHPPVSDDRLLGRVRISLRQSRGRDHRSADCAKPFARTSAQREPARPTTLVLSDSDMNADPHSATVLADRGELQGQEGPEYGPVQTREAGSEPRRV